MQLEQVARASIDTFSAGRAFLFANDRQSVSRHRHGTERAGPDTSGDPQPAIGAELVTPHEMRGIAGLEPQISAPARSRVPCAAAVETGHLLNHLSGLDSDYGGNSFHRFGSPDGTAVGGRFSGDNRLGQSLAAPGAAGTTVNLRQGLCDFLDSRVDLDGQLAVGKDKAKSKEKAQGSHGYDRDEVIHHLIIPENPRKARAIIPVTIRDIPAPLRGSATPG